MLAFVILLGCASTPERIAGSAAEIRTLAASSRDRFEAAGDSAGAAEQGEIDELAASIGVNAAGVRPTTPVWMSTLELALYVALAIAAVVIMLQTGIGTAIRRVLGWIPQRKRSAAKLLRESLDDPTKLREAVAAARTADPLLSAAWRSS